MNKDNHIRMGHWENINLDQEQCMYAATDAYVSVFLLKISNNIVRICKIFNLWYTRTAFLNQGYSYSWGYIKKKMIMVEK